jgi:hypothetical protein
MKLRYSIRRPAPPETRRLPNETMILSRYHMLADARTALSTSRRQHNVRSKIGLLL